MKRTIRLTDDSFSDHLSDDYAKTLVEQFGIDCLIDNDDPIVTRLLGWVALQSGQSSDVRYEMSRHDAVALLQQCAGFN
jgi:hypothetical protein